ncbi:SIR2 family protein [Variovorax sp. RTB1]|uniref:SIR2 family protein n=1 Tax=Variovorax sp. RTB1 TaxID=3048631 RepID=UPI002B23CED8|nr:SIR2 family protein [Variovorax sp. RTB1]MEB0114276.1 SIR2 family protein [Variovorax sp. RTB1]
MAFNPGMIPPNLKKAYEDERVVFLVGAGPSMGAGLPSWVELLELMIQEGERNNVITPERAVEYRGLKGDANKYLLLASGLKRDLGHNFQRFMEQIFVASKPRTTAFHKALVALDKTQFVVTTNYDTLIEKAFRTIDEDLSVCTYQEVGEIQRRLSNKEFFVLKAHGDASKPGNGLILTDADYRSLMYQHRGYQSLLITIFTVFTVVIVGASLSDPETKLLLNYIADAFPGASPNHFALMSKEDVTGVEKDHWYAEFNVQFVPLSKDNDYSETTEFLQALKG